MTTISARRSLPAADASAWTLPVHLAVWALVLVVAVAMAPLDSAFSSDDGAYGIQVRSLADDDRWELERPVPVVPPANEGVVNGLRTVDGPVAYPNHPFYVQALRASTGLIGDPVGLRSFVFVGALLVPLVAWHLARTTGSWPAGAFWLAALSPLLIHALGLWAHAPSAALAGLGLLAVVRIDERHERVGDAVLVGISLALAVILRRETILWAGALLVGWVACRPRPRTAAAAGGAGLLVGGALVVERAVRRDIGGERLPSVLAGNEPTGWLEGRIRSAWHTLFEPSHSGGIVALLALLAATLIVLAALRFRRAGWELAIPMFLGGLALLTVRLLLADGELTSGILVAWPIAVAALIVGGVDRRHRLPAVVVAFFVVGVLATQHPDGGGLEWGGRYFAPAIPAVAAMAAPGFRRLIGDNRVQATVIVLVLALPTVAGVRAATDIRNRNADVVEYVTQFDTPVVVTEQPALPRVAWATTPEVAWYVADEETLQPLLEQVHEAGVAALTLQGFGAATPVAPYEVAAGSDGLLLLRADR